MPEREGHASRWGHSLTHHYNLGDAMAYTFHILLAYVSAPPLILYNYGAI